MAASCIQKNIIWKVNNKNVIIKISMRKFINTDKT